MESAAHDPGENPAAGAASSRGRSRADELPEDLRRALPERRPDALERFYAVYFDRIYGYVRRLTRDEHLAEDLTQDIFLHIHRSLPRYDPSRDLRPWVFTIATHKLRDYWASRAFRDGQAVQRRAKDDDGPELEPAARGGGPAEDLEAREVGAAVARAIEQLPEGLRTVLSLRYYEGLPFEEIGRIVGRNDVAVRKRYSRALAELRTLLDDLAPPGWRRTS
jgi:RNA polymerase sigma-70 factor (ECF subfamily)